MITVWMGLSQAWGQERSGELVRTEWCGAGGLYEGSQFCSCLMDTDHERWWDNVIPPDTTGSCLDLTGRLGEATLIAAKVRAHMEERARAVARAHGWGWSYAGLVSHKIVQFVDPMSVSREDSEPEGSAKVWSVVDADGAKKVTLGLDEDLAEIAFAGDFNGDLVEDYLIVSEDESDAWIAYGPIRDAEAKLFVTEE